MTSGHGGGSSSEHAITSQYCGYQYSGKDVCQPFLRTCFEWFMVEEQPTDVLLRLLLPAKLTTDRMAKYSN